MEKKRINNMLLGAGMFICLLVFVACWALSVRWYVLQGLAVAAIPCILRTKLIKHERSLTDRKVTLIFAGCCLLLLAAQIFLILTAGYSSCLIDPQIYGSLAEKYVTTGSFSGAEERCYIYISRYPNTWGMVFFTVGWYKLWYLITGSINVYAGETLDLIAVQIGVIFTFLTARIIFPRRTDQLICGMMAAFCPIYPLYTLIFHTDIIGVGFMAPALYLAAKAYTRKGIKQFLYFAGAVLLLAIGNSIKGTLIVAAIAVGIVALLKAPLRSSLPAIALLAASIMLVNTGMMQLGLATGLSSEKELDEQRFPVVHWVMMGMNDVGGGHTREDVDFTRSAGNFKEKKKADKAEMKRRVKQMRSPKKIYARYSRKVYCTWNSGGKRYGVYLVDCKPTLRFTKVLLESKVLHRTCRFVNSALMISVIAAYVYCLRRSTKPALKTAAISLTGLILFLLLWESTSRYTVTYLPAMHLLGAAGVKYFCQATGILRKKMKK